MVNRLVNLITHVLNQNTIGLPAKSIAKQIREISGEDVRKSDINPILYKNKYLFESRNYSPPLWFLKQNLNEFKPPKKNNDLKKEILVNFKNKRDEYLENNEDFNSKKVFNLRRSLYSWQKSSIEKWNFNNGKGIIEAVTGSGKSLCGVAVVKQLLEEEKTCIVLVPSIVLLNQWKTIFLQELDFEVTSLVGGKYKWSFDGNSPITIGVVNSVIKRTNELDGFFDLLIVDECHRFGSIQNRKALFDSAVYRLGLTATLERLDNEVEETLIPYFQDIIFKFDIKKALEEDVIAKYHYYSLGIDLFPSELKEYRNQERDRYEVKEQLIQRCDFPSKSEDFNKHLNSPTRQFSQSSLEGILVSKYRKHSTEMKRIVSETENKISLVSKLDQAILSATRTLIFCETIETSRLIKERLLYKGISVTNFHSGLSNSKREDILEELGSGKLKCLVAVRALDEGIDVPDIDLGIIISGTKTKRQMIQRMGRILRRKKDTRNACLVRIYAYDTHECTRFNTNNDDDNLSLINNNADFKEQLDGNEIDSDEFAIKVRGSIFCYT